MKKFSTALLATMAASSTPAAWAATLRTSASGEKSDARNRKESSKVSTSTTSTSSGSERRLSGKSGKTAKALGLATYEDYKWIEGSYNTVSYRTLVDLEDGGPVDGSPEEGSSSSGNFGSRGTELEIESLFGSQGLAFQASLYVDVDISLLGGGTYKLREIFEGVASYDLENKVVFHTDHLEIFNTVSEEWVAFTDADLSDTATLVCKQLAKVPSGESIVCDYYGNDVFEFPGVGDVHTETISSTVWTEVEVTDEI